MPRRRSRLSRALDLKPKAFFIFERLSRLSPRMPYYLGFFPDIRPYDRTQFVHLLKDRTRESAVLKEPYREMVAPLSLYDRDVRIDSFFEKDEFKIREIAGVYGEVIVPGHTLTPVDPERLVQMELDDARHAVWHFAFPAPFWLKRRPIADLAMIVPPYRNYCHLLLDVMVPLADALRLGGAEGRSLSILTKASRPPMIEAFARGIAQLGYPVELIDMKPFEHARLKELLIGFSRCRNIERSWPVKDALPLLRQIFDAAYGPPTMALGPRLYMTRGKSRLRALVNEDELIDGLRQRGFHVFEAKWSNHAEQVARFSAASVVVGVHGAGLANMVWMRPGAHLLEIVPSTRRKTTYLNIAAELDLGYDYVLGSDEGPRESFTVDCKAFFAKLDPMLDAADRDLGPGH
jgi:hypothetical protein